MNKFVVYQSDSLSGEVTIGGAKNSALKLMAAALLAEGVTVLHNVPDITDVAIMSELLMAMGVGVARFGNRVEIDVPAQINPEAPYELVSRMRASISVLGPLIARFGVATVAIPGGDDFGSRPIDMHLTGLERLGAKFSYEHGNIYGKAGKLCGAEVLLEFPSVGATENLMMAASLSSGNTVIDNAAREPEISDLSDLLNLMGAKVAGAGTSRITIEGVEQLVPVEFTVIPDRVEAATFMSAIAVCGGRALLRNARPEHMRMLIRKMEEMGMEITLDPAGLVVERNTKTKCVHVSTLPYPGLATDYKPFLVVALAVSEGVSVVTENIFAGRFRYVDELVRMGADIRAEGRHAVVTGVSRFSGAKVRAHDIRAGAALIVAGMGADGVTEVYEAEHIDRGYENLAGKLSSLGAKVERA
ncbi:MAG: UDP-N-acetylglucosamine 1-carboxyvinyltransferase [Actinomycetota bacterium]|nr:UDP-N-acetylglucosamine 1-carboxyvinyltransferase [Acidimicrobiales bacterium]